MVLARRAGLGFLFIGYLTVAVNSAYQGGYYAATTWWLALCGVTGTLLLGRRAGLVFFGLGLATAVAFWLLEQRHHAFPNLVPADKAPFWHLDILAGLMLILLVVALVFDHTNTHTLRGMSAQNVLLSERTAQLEQSLAELRKAQAQLVQQEKMAFLGELTAGTGARVPTSLNGLVEESLRLAYQGLRAKDRAFGAHLSTALDPALPLVAVVPQDLGRVLINLLTNAFHAVRQRQQVGEPGYRPEVRVHTSAGPGGVEIRIADNGAGMSAEVQANIFRPFFTTKPAGEGTGLGLSLAHEIIAQGHGGTLTVESEQGQGTTFRVGLPLNGPA